MNKGKCTKGEFLSKLKEIVAELEEPDNSGQMMPSVCPHRQVGEQGHIKMHPTVCLDGQNAVPYPTINYDGQDAIPQKVKVLPHVFHGQATDKRQSLSIMIPVPKPPVSVELRSGVLYAGCLCTKRDGLQDRCGRTNCHGRPECLSYPQPICKPSGNAPKRERRRRAKGSPESTKGGRDPKADTAETRGAGADMAAPGGGKVLQGPSRDQEVARSRRLVLLDMGRKGYVDNPPAHKPLFVVCPLHCDAEAY